MKIISLRSHISFNELNSNKADNPAIGAEQRMLKIFEFYILNFENFRLLIQLKSCNKEEKSV